MENKAGMEKYLNQGIKDVILEFPEIGDILNEYNIGCVTCNVGSCLLKDIVKIHALPPEQEDELLSRIAEIIYPGIALVKPKIEKRHQYQPKGIKYSPPVRKLVDEHILIKRWLALIPRITEKLDIQENWGRELIINGIDFMRFYADKFHHAKEEDILFKYFNENLDIIKSMYLDHEAGRSHVRAVAQALENKDKEAVVKHLIEYKNLLKEHIKKEDEILYPWMDRGFSIKQIGELFDKFNKAEEQMNKDILEKLKRFITKTEEQQMKRKRIKQEVLK